MKEISLVCAKGHLIDHCKEFMEKSPKERTKILGKGKLSFGCSGPVLDLCWVQLLHPVSCPDF